MNVTVVPFVAADHKTIPANTRYPTGNVVSLSERRSLRLMKNAANGVFIASPAFAGSTGPSAA